MNKKLIITLFIVLVSIVFIWRGIWGLLDEYFLTDDEFWSLVIPMIAGIVLLFIVAGKKIARFLV